MLVIDLGLVHVLSRVCTLHSTIAVHPHIHTRAWRHVVALDLEYDFRLGINYDWCLIGDTRWVVAMVMVMVMAHAFDTHPRH